MQIRQRALGSLLIASLLVQSGCGTIFHPERRGQIAGKIDPMVAVLDGIGCLFFVIPGLVAFAIDFASGAIYLPGTRYSMAPERLQEAIDDDGKVDMSRLRAIIKEDTGQSLPLTDPRLIERRATPAQLAALPLLPAA